MYILDEDKFWKKVNLEDIYYFETIKSTHYCEVKTKHGNGKLHADIVALQKNLPETFYKTRASTLANLELIQKVDTTRHLLYFEEQVCCSYAGRRSKELKEKLSLCSYRNYKNKKGEEKDAHIAL